MRRLIAKVTLLSAIAVVVIVLLNSLYVRSNSYRNQVEEEGTQKFDDVPFDLQLVNLGSSHGEWAFDYDATPGVRGFNMALSSQDFYYDFQVLKRYRGHLAEDGVVLIPVSYFSFGINEGDMGFDYRYYGILPYSAIKGHNPVDYMKYRWCPLLFTGPRGVKSLFKDDQLIIDPARNLTENQYPSREVEAVGQGRAEYHIGIMDHPEADQDYNISRMEKLVDYCVEEGLKPVLVTTPYTDYYNRHFQGAPYAGFLRTIHDVIGSRDVPYLDYSHDGRFCYDIGLFLDSDHLNLTGRLLFTRTVVEDLEEEGLLGRQEESVRGPREHFLRRIRIPAPDARRASPSCIDRPPPGAPGRPARRGG